MCWASHRITLQGGFALVYDKDRHVMASFQAPPESSCGQPYSVASRENRCRQNGDAVPLHGPLSANLLASAQRNDEPVVRIAGQDYALGMAVTASGKVVVVALPMPQGLSQTTARIRAGAAEYWELFRSRNSIRATFFLMLLLITVVVFFSSVWLALFLSKQITRPVEALADAMDEIAAGKYDHRVALVTTGRDGGAGALVQSHGRRSRGQPQLAESSSAQLTAANQSIEERRRELETIRRDDSQRRRDPGRLRHCAPGQSRLCRADGPAMKTRACGVRSWMRCCRPSAWTIWPA